MRQLFSAFPEIIFIDATHKLNEYRMPLYLIMVEDGNGQSDVVAMFLAASEDELTISKFIETFKKTNEKWGKIETVMSDKDFTERKVLECALPSAKLHLCLFHVARTFRREISTEKLGICNAERIRCLEIITKIIHASSEESYNTLRDELHRSRIVSVVEYFEENWHPIRQEWVECFKSKNLTLMNRTNNRLESINQKIKDVCTKFTSLENCFEELFTVFNSLAIERDCRALEVTSKRSTVLFPSGSPQALFANHLTPYSFSFVLKQIEFSGNVKNITLTGENKCIIRKDNITRNVNILPLMVPFSQV